MGAGAQVEEQVEELVEIARRACLAGGAIVRAAAGTGVGTEEKGAGDYVTEVDLASERAIGEVLRQETPEVPVLGEELGGAAAGTRWVVDPLDGTTNFVHGFHAVGVSVALVDEGKSVVGAVHAPLLDETYLGARGLGAWLERPDREPTVLRVSARPAERAIVATGFPFRRKEVLPRYFEVMRRCLERFEDLRRPGAASLDLAWVAAGVFEGFFELELSPWDVAAGGLLVEEAGGAVSDWDGGGGWLGGDILAGSPEVHAALLEAVRG